MKIVEKNGFKDTITLIKGKVEEVSLPEGIDKVDIIISEWMGYFLLYESMLDTVLVARDKWLKPGGMLFPDRATLYICAIEDQQYRDEKIDFWNNVYGFDMSVIREQALTEPLVDIAEAKQVITNAVPILDVDINTVKKEDLDFTANFSLDVGRDDYCHAFLAYFTVDFSRCHKKVSFSTGPRVERTHWKQTVFYTDEILTCGKGEKINGTISVKRNDKNPRDLDISISSELMTEDKLRKVKQSKEYRLR